MGEDESRKREKLSAAQKRVLDAVKGFYILNGYPPSVREIAEKLGLRSTKAVFVHLRNLEDMGYIKRSRSARSIELNTEYTDIPVLGIISAGRPLLSDEHLENIYSMPAKEGIGRFFLKIHGDSMTGAGFNDGDMVLVDKNSNVRSGDIIVAIINGESTVKRFIDSNEGIYLKPENPHYEPINVDDSSDFMILGKVVGHLTLF